MGDFAKKLFEWYDGIDWGELSDQKLLLLEKIKDLSENHGNQLMGIVHMIDSLQDIAAEDGIWVSDGEVDLTVMEAALFAIREHRAHLADHLDLDDSIINYVESKVKKELGE